MEQPPDGGGGPQLRRMSSSATTTDQLGMAGCIGGPTDRHKRNADAVLDLGGYMVYPGILMVGGG